MPLFERSVATDALVELLSSCPEGGIVTWSEMCHVTNRDIIGGDRHLITRARVIALKEHGAAFGTIIRTGLRRLVPGEHVVEGKRRVKLIGSAANRGTKIMRSADMAKLTKDQALTHAATAGVLLAIENSSRARPNKGPSGGNPDPVVTIPETPG